jgi:hypothetical protein
VKQLAGLLADRLHHSGRAMSKAVHCHAGDKIEVLVSRCVPDMHTLTLDEGDGIASISGGDMAFGQLDDFFIHL